MPLGTEREKQALPLARVQPGGASRTAHRARGSVGAAGRDCCTGVELGQETRTRLGIQMMLPGGDRILAGLGRMDRSPIGR